MAILVQRVFGLKAELVGNLLARLIIVRENLDILQTSWLRTVRQTAVVYGQNDVVLFIYRH